MAGGELPILAIIFLASAVIATALGVVWVSFGRERHAASWAMAFVAAGVETVTTAAHALWPRLIAIRWLDLLLMLLASALVTAGARQRADPPGRGRAPLIAVVPVFLLLGGLQLVPPLVPIARAAAFFFATVMFVLACRALVPSGRRALPAERLAIGCIALFALLEVVLGTAILAAAFGADPAHDAVMLAGVRMLYLIAHPSLSVAAGIAAILLVASDLAERLRRLAAFDPLTGVHNRRGFEEAALRAVAGARRNGRPLTVAIADIDHFKTVNDRFGHRAGDETLRHVAQCLSGGVRAGDLVGRVGGDEFALLLLDADAESGVEVLDRLRTEIALGFCMEGAPTGVTMSFGVAPVPLDDAGVDQALDIAVARADRALYAGKRAGRDRATIAGTTGT